MMNLIAMSQQNFHDKNNKNREQQHSCPQEENQHVKLCEQVFQFTIP